ncbi:MAG: DUF4421 family protein [Prevotella sp.]|nr:DUF4421 family protein [Prevotella sp.]
MNTRKCIQRKWLLAAVLLMAWPAKAEQTTDADQQASTATVSTQKKGSWLKRAVSWFGDAWSGYDPAYSVPSFYDWAVQLQNTSSWESLETKSQEGMDVMMRSRPSHKIGPYFGWNFLFYGATIDLSTIGKPKTKGKNEFTLSINSNLLNLDLIRRRTGGDFDIKRMRFTDFTGHTTDLTDWVRQYNAGDYIKNSLTGFNLNIFTNHRKYSNPAAFSNGAIQLRSAGTPIVGFGYTQQKVESDIAWIFSDAAADLSVDEHGNALFSDQIWESNLEKYSDMGDIGAFFALYDMLDNAWPYMTSTPEKANVARSLLTNKFPTLTKIDDWHLQLGYAYNLVFSRRLLLGLSLVASPGIKHVRSTNEGSFTNEMADVFAELVNSHEGTNLTSNDFILDFDDRHVNLNIFGRASLVWNHNRWRAGVTGTFSKYYYNHHGMDIDNSFANLTAYVGYCFGRKKEYRHDGAKRRDYIMAALTKSQIAEISDTLPRSNVSTRAAIAALPADSLRRSPYAPGGTRRYHLDHIDLDIQGCDLVAGPDGRYGTFEITDGYVTPGQDSEQRTVAGTVLDIDKDGVMSFKMGHNSSIRAGNWWKSQLRKDQIVNQWYPELLFYALRGKLTLNVRGRIFGTKQPVQLVLDDVCINRGKEARTFKQMGVKTFRSRSAHSIEGQALVNGRQCRVYIEQRKRGKSTQLYISRFYPAMSSWMKHLSDNKPLSRISMPGTHDSGSSSIASNAIGSAGHTQNFAVGEQLRDGIRAFDIRLKSDMHFGHTLKCRERFDSTMVEWDRFLADNPSECIVAMVGSDEGGKWSDEMRQNFQTIIDKYPHRFVENFAPATPLGQVRGKILVLKRQEQCPFGRLLKFQDNAVFSYDGFHVEDVYKEFKSWKKLRLVEQHLRESFEADDPGTWYVTFCSIAWSPRRHTPYSYAWGARNIRKPININLNMLIEMKDYSELGMVFLDYYNNHGENPQLVQSIVKSNFQIDNAE